MRHPSLLGNKQLQVLRELGGGHSLVWEVVLGSLLGAPLFSPRPWMPVHNCWNLRLSLGHHRGDSSCTWCVDACAVAAAGCLVVPHVSVSCGVFLFSHACSWA